MRWPAAGLLLSLALVLVAGCAGRPLAVGAAMPPEAVAAGAAAYPAPAAPFAEPDDDPFHARGLPAELAATPPGTILRYRPIAPQAYYFFDVDARAWQVAYRSTNSHGRPQINVATVLIPADPEPRLLSYQVAYDALTRRCAPSREILSGSMVEHGLMNKALSVRTGQTHVRRWTDDLVRRIDEGQIDPSFVITHSVGLDEGPEMYNIFRNKQDGCVKVVLKP